MRFILDRLEDNNRAVLEKEDGSTFAISRDKLPKEAREGDCLELSSDGNYQILPEETEKRRKRIQNLLDNLWE